MTTIESRIYAPCFATLVLVESAEEAYMWDLTFYLANTPPLQGPRLDVDTGILYYRPLQKLVRHQSTFTSLVLQKLDGQDRLTEVVQYVYIRRTSSCCKRS